MVISMFRTSDEKLIMITNGQEFGSNVRQKKLG